MLTLARHPIIQVSAIALALGSVSASPFLAGGEELREAGLVEFEADFLAHAQEVGTIIEVGTSRVQGMKRAIGPIERGELAGDALEAAARVWEESITEVATRFTAISVPHDLGLARDRALAAYASYVDLARTLGSIGDEPEALVERLDRAVALGTRGDEQFDAAAAVIQDARRRLGLEPHPSLPDPDRPLPDGVQVHEPHELYPEDF